MHPIDKFEAARRSLGHAALLRPEDIADIRAAESDPLEALILFAERLRDARDCHMAEFGHVIPIAPVLPSVDVADMQVTHVTCTGNTRLVLLPPARHREDWSFQAIRLGGGTLAEAHPEIAALDALADVAG